MSTRATVHFCNSVGTTQAIVYRHCDGYPSGLGDDLNRFLNEVKAQTSDTRFNDPSYLAAKFVVWQAGEYAKDKSKPLDFLSVGVVLRNPGDIEYQYKVVCGATFDSEKLPEVEWVQVR